MVTVTKPVLIYGECAIFGALHKMGIIFLKLISIAHFIFNKKNVTTTFEKK